MTTEKSLQEMLTENTGRHMLDSGGAHGRNWELNQGRDFELGSEAWIDRWGGVSLSVYHFLKERLEYDEKIDSFFETWGRAEPRADEPWLSLSDDFLCPKDGPLAKMGFTLGGIYGDGDPMIVNTYYGE